MSPAFALFTFVNVWWVMLFITLPFGIRKDTSKNPLHYVAAPKLHRWKKLLLINAMLSMSVTFALALLLKSGMIPLDNLY